LKDRKKNSEQWKVSLASIKRQGVNRENNTYIRSHFSSLQQSLRNVAKRFSIFGNFNSVRQKKINEAWAVRYFYYIQKILSNIFLCIFFLLFDNKLSLNYSLDTNSEWFALPASQLNNGTVA
jgi:hypothetical protein